MAERYCALIIGILFAVVGVAGFLPGLVSLPPAGAPVPVDASPNLYAAGFGYILGLFPTNLLHNIVRIIVGSLGIAAYTSLGGAVYTIVVLRSPMPYSPSWACCPLLRQRSA